MSTTVKASGIRQFASSLEGSIIAAAEFEHTVHIWSLARARHVSTFQSILDCGGNRLAISRNGKQFIAGAYYVEGIAAYSTSKGSLLWRRKDLKKPQFVRYSVDQRRVYCCFDKIPCQALCAKSGETLKTWSGIDGVWESPFEFKWLLQSGDFVLGKRNERPIARIPCESFGVLDVAFGPDRVCISEAGGPVRCLETRAGSELWRFALKDEHFLELAYNNKEKAIFAICYRYQQGGPMRLFRFEVRSGEATVLADLSPSFVFAFCKNGSRLICSNGTVINTANGSVVRVLPFPQFKVS
jgi:outer membrane protein assembly factor BamB